jgi:hypothetical protein
VSAFIFRKNIRVEKFGKPGNLNQLIRQNELILIFRKPGCKGCNSCWGQGATPIGGLRAAVLIGLRADSPIGSRVKRIAQQKLDELTMKIEDVEALIEDVTDVAYDKAVDVVTEKVREETLKQNLKVIDLYHRSITDPKEKNSKQVVQLSNKILSRVKEKLRESAGMIVGKVQAVLKSPEIKMEKKEEIKGKARESIRSKLERGRIEADRHNRERWEHQKSPTGKKQNMEH